MHSQQLSNTELTRLSRVLMVGGAAVSLAILLLIVQFVFRPLQLAKANLQQELTQLRAVVATRSVVAVQHRDLAAELRAVLAEQAALRARIPESPQESVFLGQLARAAEAASLEIGQFQPQQTTSRAEYDELDVRLSLQGEFAGLCQFLYELRDSPRLCRITHLEVVPSPDSAHECRAEIQFAIYFTSPAKSPQAPRTATLP